MTDETVRLLAARAKALSNPTRLTIAAALADADELCRRSWHAGNDRFIGAGAGDRMVGLVGNDLIDGGPGYRQPLRQRGGPNIPVRRPATTCSAAAWATTASTLAETMR